MWAFIYLCTEYDKDSSDQLECIDAALNTNGDMRLGLGDKISLYSLQLQAGIRVTPQTR